MNTLNKTSFVPLISQALKLNLPSVSSVYSTGRFQHVAVFHCCPLPVLTAFHVVCFQHVVHLYCCPVPLSTLSAFNVSVHTVVQFQCCPLIFRRCLLSTCPSVLLSSFNVVLSRRCLLSTCPFVLLSSFIMSMCNCLVSVFFPRCLLSVCCPSVLLSSFIAVLSPRCLLLTCPFLPLSTVSVLYTLNEIHLNSGPFLMMF